jgi:hypothetical protein
MGVLYTALCLLFFLNAPSDSTIMIILKCTMRVSISVFPPAPKLSSLELKSYLPALTILNVGYLLKDESYPLKVHYNA